MLPWVRPRPRRPPTGRILGLSRRSVCNICVTGRTALSSRPLVCSKPSCDAMHLHMWGHVRACMRRVFFSIFFSSCMPTANADPKVRKDTSRGALSDRSVVAPGVRHRLCWRKKEGPQMLEEQRRLPRCWRKTKCAWPGGLHAVLDVPTLVASSALRPWPAAGSAPTTPQLSSNGQKNEKNRVMLTPGINADDDSRRNCRLELRAHEAIIAYTVMPRRLELRVLAQSLTYASPAKRPSSAHVPGTRVSTRHVGTHAATRMLQTRHNYIGHNYIVCEHAMPVVGLCPVVTSNPFGCMTSTGQWVCTHVAEGRIAPTWR